MSAFSEFLGSFTENKNVCILGFGREGKSTYRLLKDLSPASVTVCDLFPVDRNANCLPDEVRLICGEDYQKSLSDFDIVFKSPGIVLEKQPCDLDCIVTSETQLFFEFFRDKIIGITGTKGKSTVSSLIWHILKESGKKTLFAGNIGIPVFDIADDVDEDTLIVCELSCHQLEYMSVSPHIAVMLNLYEEHLDHYGSMERYHNAKKNIYLHQRKSDRLIINYALVPVETEATVFSISNTDRGGDFFVGNSTLTCNMGPVYKIPADDIKLLGIHNHYNVAVAYLVANMCNVSDEDFTKAICTFNPLAHRLEFVAEVDGVRYYDDSISTACATAVEAVKSVPDPGTILIGGMDRGIDYAPLIQFLSSVDINVICMEASGNRIYSEIASAEFNSPERVFLVQHLEDAVKLANEITPKGKSCVLSPASASYGIFKNFEERGDVFKSLVNQL